MTDKNYLIPVLFGAKRPLYPIDINFDGDQRFYFLNDWDESGGNVTNDQIALGAELVTNGDFAAWTGDDPDGWIVVGEVGADPEVSEVGAGQGHGGAGNGFCNIYTTAADALIRQTILTVGGWHSFSVLYDTVISGTLLVGDGSANGINTGVAGAKAFVVRAESTAARAKRGTTPTDITIDDYSVKLQTLTSLLNNLKSQFGLSDGFFIDIYINAVTAGTQVGVIWNYDGSNNFGMAYMDGVNLIVDKNVAGTYSNLASVAQAVTPDQILRIENPTGSNVLDILYNGVSKATPTISDAGIISNTGIALFSTEANNAISKVVIGQL